MSMLSPAPQELQAGTSHVPLPGDKWRPEEDATLNKLLENNTSWKVISENIPGRSERSCIRHYYSQLQKVRDNPKTAEVIRLYDRYFSTALKLYKYL